MAYAHGGLALLGVDLHEVGDLLALTNFLVQLHMSTEASKRHLTNLGDTTLQKVINVVVDDELLALVLQMIISPTLNSLSQIWPWWKRELGGKQLGKARDQDSYGGSGAT
jgi:hypothetical protein